MLIGLIVFGAIVVLGLVLRLSRALVDETVRDVREPMTAAPSQPVREKAESPGAMPGPS